jgi:hypothetical protein
MNDEEVRRGKEKELKALQDKGVYSVVQLPRGKRAIGTRWVLKAKESNEGLVCKARVVVQQINKYQSTDFYAPTPSLSCLRLLLSHNSWSRNMYSSQNFALQSFDVSTAFLHAALEEEVYVRAPPGVQLKPGEVWRLHRALYGLRAAPALWSQHLCGVLESVGFSRSLAEPSLYYQGSGADQVLLLIHVDDALVSGPAKSVAKIMSSLSSSLSMTTSPALLRDGDTCKLLGRIITRTRDGYTMTGDESLAKLSLDALGLSGKTRPVTSPCVPKSSSPSLSSSRPLSAAEHGEYRVHVGRLAYMSADRLDLQYAVKSLSRQLASPTVEDFEALKRCFRYIKSHPILTYHYTCKSAPSQVTVYCDSDWGADPVSRKSTSGAVCLLDRDVLLTYSRTQSSVSLSSTEAELTSAVTACCEGLHLVTILKELSLPAKLVLFSDSKAGIDHLSRLGTGKLKHLQLRAAFLQQLIHRKEVHIRKVLGAENISDLLTKAVAPSTLWTLLRSDLMNVVMPSHPDLVKASVVVVDKEEEEDPVVDVSSLSWSCLRSFGGMDDLEEISFVM